MIAGGCGGRTAHAVSDALAIFIHVYIRMHTYMFIHIHVPMYAYLHVQLDAEDALPMPSAMSSPTQKGKLYERTTSGGQRHFERY